MLKRLRQHLPKWSWLDWFLLRLEAFGALLDQYGLRPSLATVISAMVAIVLGGWSYLTQPWLPLAITITIVVFAILWIAWRMAVFMRATQSGTTTTASNADPAKTPEAEERRQFAVMQNAVRHLNRTAWLLTSAAVGDYYNRRLEDGLKWFMDHPRRPPFETNEQLQAEVGRVQEFISDLQSNLAPSHWTAELYRTIQNAEHEASYDEEKMTVPDGLNPFQYRKFHIACLQYDRIGQFLEQSVQRARGHEQEIHQMMRDRPDLHK